MAIIVVLILPLPPVLLDALLAVSIVFSVLILMTALFIQTPLEFSSFPTVLLIAAMMRLALNLASTRLILANGHNGPDAAGHVIEAFGNFVMRGNFVIGVVVFAILVIVNFIVITKGSGRIAEVAARFNLDAMPGKQMAIDADLSAGLIDENVAREAPCKTLEAESAFFGNMDGASKFVRGDAIAGLLITFINIIAGMVIGVLQQGLSFQEAGNNYTLLTVGDGLVSQIPSLIVSTAAGLLVSKAGVLGSADKALVEQFTGYPKALGMSSAVIGVLAFLPGMPILPFIALAGGIGYLAFRSTGKKARAMAKAAAEALTGKAAGRQSRNDELPIAESLKIDELKLELGYGLLVAGQGRRERLRPPDRTDQGAAPPACDRARLRHAAGPHPRQHAARAQRLHSQDQGSRRRQGPHLRQPADGDGPDGQGDHPARLPHHRADLRPARHLDRAGAARRGRAQGLLDHRPLDGDLDPPHRSAEGQRRRPLELRQCADAAQRHDQGTAEAARGSDPEPDLGRPASSAYCRRC